MIEYALKAGRDCETTDPFTAPNVVHCERIVGFQRSGAIGTTCLNCATVAPFHWNAVDWNGAQKLAQEI
jgi:hypothetical protein